MIDSDKNLDETSFKCIEKHHLEMLNGSRPLNLKSTVPHLNHLFCIHDQNIQVEV